MYVTRGQHAMAIVEEKAREDFIRLVRELRLQERGAVARTGQCGTPGQRFAETAPRQFQRSDQTRALRGSQPRHAREIPREQCVQSPPCTSRLRPMSTAL